MVERTEYSHIRCADQEAQKTYKQMRELFEMIFVGRIIQPWEYYGVSAYECVCEGDVGYKVELNPSEVVVHCKKSS